MAEETAIAVCLVVVLIGFAVGLWMRRRARGRACCGRRAEPGEPATGPRVGDWEQFAQMAGFEPLAVGQRGREKRMQHPWWTAAVQKVASALSDRAITEMSSWPPSREAFFDRLAEQHFGMGMSVRACIRDIDCRCGDGVLDDVWVTVAVDAYELRTGTSLGP